MYQLKLKHLLFIPIILICSISEIYADHFSFSYPSTLSYMNFYGDVFTIDGTISAIGDEIAIFDQSGTICGHYIVTNPGYFNITVYGDDTSSSEDEGASINEELIFIIWDTSENIEIRLQNSMYIQKEVFGSPQIDTVPPSFLGNREIRGMGIAAVTSATIDSVSPEILSICGGGILQITGTKFQSLAEVTIDGITLTVISMTSTAITCVIPPHDIGIATLTVINPDGMTATHDLTYEYYQFTGRIPDTGQTKCSDNENEIPCPNSGESFYGQDANYNINPQSFTKLDNQGNELPDSATEWTMVRDNVTGLVWEIKTDDGSIHDKNNKYTWYDSNPEANGGYTGTNGEGTDTEDFIKALNESNFGGFSDWRLPTIAELQKIVSYENVSPSINKSYFPETASSFYWSSTSLVDNTVNSRGIDFIAGNDSARVKYSSFYVRAVRGQQCQPYENSENLVINKDGTITDTCTGLMWQKEAATLKMTWQDAIEYCENLSFSDFNDWRLPTLNELRSIVDYSKFNPAINQDLFKGFLSAFYWSSTSTNDSMGGAWGLYFNNGLGDRKYKDLSNYVRAVRGGQNQSFKRLIIWSPEQSSKWQAGDKMSIKWDTQNISGDVTISISHEGGKTDSFIPVARNIPNDGVFEWTVTQTPSFNCMLKIEPENKPEKGTMQGLFSIINDPPIVSDILDQTILEGSSFTPIILDNYVTDIDNDKTAISWTVTGQVDLKINITNRIATIEQPHENWSGSEIIRFIAKDPEGLTSSAIAQFTVIRKPLVINLANDPNPTKSKTWNWSSNRDCTFRYFIDQNSSWQPSGNFHNTQTATKSNADGKWYVHVQAKDNNGYLSDVVSVFAILDNTRPVITGIENDPVPQKSKTWTWQANENDCLFRYAVNQNNSWIPSGEYNTFTTATKLGYGQWYIHVETIDRAGNVSDVFSGSVQLLKPTIQFNGTFSEGDESISPITLEFVLSHISSEEISVGYLTQNDLSLNHATRNKDYLLPDDNMVVIQAGKSKGTIELTIIDDHISENNENCIITLHSPSHSVLLDEAVTYNYTILDNDHAEVSIVESDDFSDVSEDGKQDNFTIVLKTEPLKL